MRKSLLTLAVATALAVSAGLASSADPISQLETRAEGGDTQAMLETGRAYLDGAAVPRDEDRGLSWLVRATEGPRANARAALILAEYYERQAPTPGNRGLMVQYYRRAAILGHTTAQTRLGAMLLASASDARLSAENQTQARTKGQAMLEHAAAAGHAPAAIALADAFRRGAGVEADETLAERFDRRAADLGDATAAWRLAQIYLAGESPRHKPADGLTYLRAAADADLAPAMAELARRFADGEGMAADRAAARTWAERAEKAGAREATSLLARLKDEAAAPPAAITKSSVADAPSVAATAVPASRSDAALRAREAAPPAVDLAFDTAGGAPLGELASKTYDDLLGDVDRLQANLDVMEVQFKQLRQQLADQQATISALTAERDEAIAQVRSLTPGDQASRGLTSRQPAPRAAVASAASSNIDEGGERANDAGLAALRRGDLGQARQQFERAAHAGHAGALNNLGMMYLQGRGVQPSVPHALDYLARAAERGNGVAANNLGYLYQHGRGVAADRDLAITWYRRAVALGHKASDRQLRALGASQDSTLAATSF
jgi:TPR repeat protein